MTDTKRIVNHGAERHLGVDYRVLDKGSVKLVDYLGADVSIVAAARHSYDRRCDPEDLSGNTRLINYLVKHNHTSPLEQVSLSFEVKAPVFVFREWHRHRTGRLNEMSARYTELPEEFYVPRHNRVRAQSASNKQGSGDLLPEDVRNMFREAVRRNSVLAFDEYRWALEAGVSRELARILLPVNVYSKMVWQMDLNNLLKFIRLRSHFTAQEEIREYSDSIALIVSDAFPITWEAFLSTVQGKQA